MDGVLVTDGVTEGVPDLDGVPELEGVPETDEVTDVV